jgi:hypothetical protein
MHIKHDLIEECRRMDPFTFRADKSRDWQRIVIADRVAEAAGA